MNNEQNLTTIILDLLKEGGLPPGLVKPPSLLQYFCEYCILHFLNIVFEELISAEIGY